MIYSRISGCNEIHQTPNIRLTGFGWSLKSMPTKKSANIITATVDRLSLLKVARTRIKAKVKAKSKTNGVIPLHLSKVASSSNRAVLAEDEAQQPKVRRTKGKERTRAKQRKEVQAKAKAKIIGTTVAKDHGDIKADEMVPGTVPPTRTIGHSHKMAVSLTHHVEADIPIFQFLLPQAHITG